VPASRPRSLLKRRSRKQPREPPGNVGRPAGQFRLDTDLASVRDAETLNRLAAEERDGWEKMWAEIEVL